MKICYVSMAFGVKHDAASKDVDPQAYLDLLRRYRDLSAWDEVVRLASELPSDVAGLPQVAQTVALAQGRLGNTDAARSPSCTWSRSRWHRPTWPG
jgi:hypothetical protein